MMRQLRKGVGAAVLGTVVSGAAVAADPGCATVRMADPGADITSTNAIAGALEGWVTSRRCG